MEEILGTEINIKYYICS